MPQIVMPAQVPNAATVATAALAIVTVTYHPDLAILESQLEALPEAALKVIVDNASTDAQVEALRILCAGIRGCTLLENRENLGLPAAINQGARHAQEILPNCGYLLLLDQDTQPAFGGVEQLLISYQLLDAGGCRPGCVGPVLQDVATEAPHGFHQVAGWRWVRRFPAAIEHPLECATLNCSGTLTSMDLFTQLGGLDADFFVDHLDTEWSFRVRAAGYRLYGIPAVSFRHRMGQKTWRVWLGGWRLWPYRAPQRHYLLFRNTLWLMRRSYVPGVWKFWALVKLALTMAVHVVLDPMRWAQLRSMVSGLAAGLQGPEKGGMTSSRAR